MKSTWTIDNQAYEVELQRDADGRILQAKVNGESVEVSALDDRQITLKDGSVLGYAIDWDTQGSKATVQYRGLNLACQRVRAEDGEDSASSGRCLSPMNGQVTKIYHQNNDLLERDQVVLVLEAMKMENEITAPRAGKLSNLSVSLGSIISQGDLLFEIEETP